jgi:hypothetical protein
MTERELVENYLRIDKRMPIATSHLGGYAVAYPLRRTMPRMVARAPGGDVGLDLATPLLQAEGAQGTAAP